MLLKLAVLLAVAAVGVFGDTCLHCICLHESGCKPIGCHMDVGSLSCGYYQIKWPYYEDCGQPGGQGQAAWQKCADDYNCATGCVNAYVNRYKGNCAGVGACQQMSRLHNGGPNGCHVSGTLGYWSVIQKCCGCS
uniref:lysozyme n=1 Tax=Plectus sambesii TaxID=2011161 RepID=A0A914VQT7_9BILA